jgi:hypothetical protein
MTIDLHKGRTISMKKRERERERERENDEVLKKHTLSCPQDRALVCSLDNAAVVVVVVVS